MPEVLYQHKEAHILVDNEHDRRTALDENLADSLVIFALNYEKAWNQQERDEVLGYFEFDAIFEITPALPGMQAPHSGRSQVATIVDQLLPGYHADSTDYIPEGTDVSWVTTVSSDLLRKLGAPTVDGTVRVTVSGNKMQTHTLTPESARRLQGQGNTPAQG